MADAAAGIWAAPVLSRSFNQTPEMFGGWMGAVIFGSGIIGAVVGGKAGAVAPAGAPGLVGGLCL